MGDISAEAKRIFAAKEARRQALAGLSYPEKVRVIVRLRMIAAPLLRARGRHLRVWPIDPATSQRSSSG